jgi:hypothetical protein
MSIIESTPYSRLSLAELRADHAKFDDLLSHTTVESAREPVRFVRDTLATWIARREAEAGQGVAA